MKIEKMDVTLVYPCIRGTVGFNGLGKSFGSFDSLFINHGLTSLAACIEQCGKRVHLLDLRDLKSWSDVTNWIKKDPSKIYGITMHTLDYHEVIKVASIIRMLKPKSKIIVGGPHPSILPNEVSKETVFDHIVIGEGEIVFPELINNADKFDRMITGEHPNLDELPYEKREIFNLEKIFRTKLPPNSKPVISMPYINVISGRGCVWNCGFCKPGEDKIFGKFRMRSLDHFFGEIQQLNDTYNFQTLMIDDDSFTLHTNYVLAFCELYGEKIHKKFFCQSRTDFICKNIDIMKRLKQAGLDTVFIGFESGSQRMLDFMQKGTTVEQNFEAAEICKKIGIKIWANYMVGLPTETKEEMQATFDMIEEIKPDRRSGNFFTPHVGTHLFDYCKKNNLMISEDPAILGSRNPSVPKLKNLDYNWMRKKMYPGKKLWMHNAGKILRKIRQFKDGI